MTKSYLIKDVTNDTYLAAICQNGNEFTPNKVKALEFKTKELAYYALEQETHKEDFVIIKIIQTEIRVV